MDLTTSSEDDSILINSKFQDPLLPEIHAELDEDAQTLSDISFETKAPWILSTVLNASVAPYSTTGWPIDPAVVKLSACKELLASNQELRDLLDTAHRSGQYAEIRSRGEK
jgi:hypothetical protein